MNKHLKKPFLLQKKQRERIIEKLQQTDEIEWDKAFYIGESKSSIRSYFTGFLEHDDHHREQISSV